MERLKRVRKAEPKKERKKMSRKKLLPEPRQIREIV